MAGMRTIHRRPCLRRVSFRMAWLLVLLPIMSAFVATACSDKDDEPFPSVVFEMADVFTNDRGQLSVILLDDSTALRISNDVSGFQPRAGYRCLCGYVPSNGTNYVELLSLSPAYLLYDCAKETLRDKDPLSVVSVWRGGCRYLNMHLLPKTKGGEQHWGYLVDSVRINSAGGSTYHLSLLHDQGTDTTAYSTDFYMSISLDSLTNHKGRADSVDLGIVTWDGLRHYGFSLR